jgi:hypothetical protein
MTPSGSRPFPFVITGSVSAVDSGRRRFRVGETELEATGDATLDELTIGMTVLVRGEMDPATGRARAAAITSIAPAIATFPDVPRLLRFVRSVVDELGESEVACEVMSVDENAAIRLWLTDEIGKDIQLSRRMLEWGLVDRRARRTIRSVLQTAIGILRSRRGLHAMRHAAYQCRVDGTAGPDPQCGRCGQPMTEVPGEVEDLKRRHRPSPG